MVKVTFQSPCYICVTFLKCFVGERRPVQGHLVSVRVRTRTTAVSPVPEYTKPCAPVRPQSVLVVGCIPEGKTDTSSRAI